MIKVKFLTDWNKELLLKAKNKELTDFQIKIIESILAYFDIKDYFHGLFQAIAYSGISPFIATHDYCIKILYCNQYGTIEMNISPIYHLGLEYPENYKIKHGRGLDQEAIIGLLGKQTAGTPLPGYTSYFYGVDAGILFKNSKISHNKKIILEFEPVHEGLLVTLSCEHHTSSTTLLWADIGLQGNSSLADICHLSNTEIFPVNWDNDSS